ncbi:MAG TPA: hypothetical protein VHG32_15795 [Thermoanaerobaculia bacterium]|jgi:hypothetical protein|nr:hypothetical protein [Thermoanaerobaculia bacterium]
MDSIVLRILLDGLIALVPIDSSHLTALVVDGTRPPVEASPCVGLHKAMLEFTFVGNQGDYCKSKGCTVDGNTCTCNLNDHQYQVSFVATALPSSVVLKQQPDQPMPVMPGQAADPSYLFDLSRLAQLDSTFLTSGPAPGLLGRMQQFPFTRLTACNLALRNHSGTYSAHTFNFRRLGAPYDVHQPTQAVAQALIAEADVPSGNVVLRLEDLGGGNPRDFELARETCGQQGCANVRLFNHRDEIQENNPCNKGTGFDFAYYYQLVQNQPSWQDRPLPQLDTVTELEGHVAVQACTAAFPPHAMAATTNRAELHFATSRPVCAMAFFN